MLIAGKDLRQRMRDRSAFLIALVVPLVLASIFGLIFHNAIGGRVTFTFGLVDEDHGIVAKLFLTQALRPLEQQKLVTLRIEPSLAAGRAAADGNRVAATFVLPAGLSQAVASGQPASIDVLGSVDAPIGAQVAQSIAASFATHIDAARIATRAGVRSGIAELPTPITVVDVSTKSRQLDAGTYYAAGMAVFFVFFTVQFGISSILDERRDGTLARIMVAPIRRGSVLGGKVLTSLILGSASMVVLAVATHFLLSATWGNPLGVVLLILAAVLAATGVMSLVVTFARTPDQAQAWQSMVALLLGMLGGTFFPVAQAGGALAALSLLTPQAWFLRGIENLAGGAGARAALGPVLVMLVFAFVTGTAAFLRSNRLVAR